MSPGLLDLDVDAVVVQPGPGGRRARGWRRARAPGRCSRTTTPGRTPGWRASTPTPDEDEPHAQEDDRHGDARAARRARRSSVTNGLSSSAISPAMTNRSSDGPGGAQERPQPRGSPAAAGRAGSSAARRRARPARAGRAAGRRAARVVRRRLAHAGERVGRALVGVVVLHAGVCAAPRGDTVVPREHHPLRRRRRRVGRPARPARPPARPARGARASTSSSSTARTRRAASASPRRPPTRCSPRAPT